MSTPDTVVLVHGFWVTPRSWEQWISHYEAKGYRVIAPACPGVEVEVEALNADPTPIAEVTLPQIVEHYERVIAELDAPPIIIGHSAGGLITQVLLDHGHGAVGVTLNSVPPEGVKVKPWSQLHSTFPILRNPANRHRAAGFTFDQFHYAFTNGVDEDLARTLYERYAIAAPGRIIFESVTADLKPGHGSTSPPAEVSRPASPQAADGAPACSTAQSSAVSASRSQPSSAGMKCGPSTSTCSVIAPCAL